MSGIAKGGQSNAPSNTEVEDMIGIAKMPLKSLIKKPNMNETVDIKDFEGKTNGQVVIKIQVIDPSLATKKLLNMKASTI